MTSNNVEKPERKARRETGRLLALCALLCVPLLFIAPIVDAGYRIAYRMVPTMRKKAAADLYEAIANGNLKTVQTLIARGVDVNNKDSQPTPPLATALQWGRRDAALLLVKKGANLNKPDSSYNGETAFFYTVIHVSSLLLVKEMILSGANVNQRSLVKASINDHLEYQGNVLSQAISVGRNDVALLLVQAGADINARSGGLSNDLSPLNYAATKGNLQMVNLLLKQGANVNAPSSESPLIAASVQLIFPSQLHNELKMIEVLLSHGADVDASNKYHSPLYCAAGSHTPSLVQTLLDKGAKINWQNSEGWSALTLASFVGDVRIVQLLLQRGANPNLRDKHGKTALDYARRHKKIEVIRVLEDAMRTQKSKSRA